jgi:hypothetical protein
VRAFNGTTPSAYSNVAANVSGAAATVPAAPTGFTVAMTPAGLATLTWSHPGGANLTDFTIQRATNATFTLGVASLSAAAGATTIQDATPGAGTYYYRIRANGSAGSSAWTNGSPFPAVAGALTFMSVTASRPSPFAPDGTTSITWTAIATGGIGPLQYEFWRYQSGVGWTMVQAYGTANTYTWTPGLNDAGTYTIQVWVRNAGSTASYDVWGNSSSLVVQTGPLTVTAVTPSPASPTTVGTPVTWSAAAAGGIGPLQYQFWLYANGAWTLIQAYSTSNTAPWTPTQAGTYTVQVWVRNAGSGATYDAWLNSASFVVQ